MPARFAHLHLHSEFSLVDSTLRIKEMVAACAARNLPTVALTDQNNLFALVKFWKAAEGAGIKPIAGADVLVAEGNEPASRLTLLCRNYDGYLRLSQLLTLAWMEGHRNDGVVIRPKWLRESTQGLFAIAGPHSAPGQLFAAGREDHATQALRDLHTMFDNRLHLELLRTQRPGEEAWLGYALSAAETLSLPVVASNDVRFKDPSGFSAHEARVCIATGRVLDDPKRPHDYSEQQYLKSADEMAALFADIPDAIDNTLALAQRCNLQLRLGTYFLPAFPVPDDETLDSWIRSQAHAGLTKRLETHPIAAGKTREDYFARLDIELGVIIRMGFPGYFLIVADFINWGKQNGIPVGPGRGSGAGSLVAWALGITDLDPLPYDLLFERFLNPERVSMPDFDIDFCMDRRDEVIDYVARKYGRDRVSQIITYGTMAAKAVIRDTGRVLGNGYGFVDGVAKLIPMTLGIGLEDALGRTEKSKSDEAWRSDELIARYESEEDVRELVDLALQLEDLTRNAGKHAGGVVIAPTPLSDFCPLYAENDGTGRGQHPVTQFDKDDVEAVGLVKFDFLGLRTLTIIDWAVKAINQRRTREGQAPVDIAALPLDDHPTYELFARGDTVAVFQFESSGMRRLLKDAKPDRFEDLIALVSLYRPGPMDLIPDFIARKHGRAEVVYPHALLEPVLKPTYGVVVYQEQVMQTAQILAGYSLGGADLLRRAMGKKKAEEMAKERVKFEAGALEHHGIEGSVSGPIFDLLEKFASYGFNKSHAAAYALVSYQTAWLKAHYPAEFMAAVLSSDMDNTDKVVGFLEEVRVLNLAVLPPDVNASLYMFEAVTPNTLRYGLGAVKGVGQGVCEAIVAAREEGGAFRDLLDFCQRVSAGGMNKRTLEALIHAGALDALASNRASLMQQLPEAMKATDQAAKNRAAGMFDMFGGGGSAEIRIELVEVPEWPLAQKLAGERETLGHYLSGHPMDPYRDDVSKLVGHDLSAVPTIWENGSRNNRPQEGRSWRPMVQTVLAGQVVGVRKRGESQAFVQLEDGRGRVECGFFNEQWQEFAPLLTRDQILVVEGGLREDEFNGGYSLRATRCWDFTQLCNQQAQRISIRIDLREPEAFPRFEALLKAHQGTTPVLLEVITHSGIGRLTINGGRGLRVDAQLPGLLRRLPGVGTVSMQLARPWVNGG
ncbi:MAG: DNA polymerase III subunit alpha [Thermomonas sp.]|uniref:DNA polymerase III subunit alpha n=1 Tax=Thermomonas sp. TaxID=1971895 RepID=UPI001EB6E7D5|nr:DNA polymerase III subunit alpha [Thermomonas sp.]MBV2208028.1 DNA polymerase III subunit alpha [Thermomonas sp.]